MKVIEIIDTGVDDVLIVKGEDADGNEVYAHGWVSALENNYPASAYTDDPETGLTRDEKAKPKKMTKSEVGEYALGLLEEQNPVAPTPRKITFS